MSFSPTITRDSAALPGVQFTVNRIGIARRAAIDQATLVSRQRLRELELDYPQRSKKEEALAEQLEIAQRKLAAVPEEQQAAVLKDDVMPLAEELASLASPEVQKQRRVLDEEYATVQGHIRCSWVRAGLVSISGGEVDGMTVDQLLDYGPIELADEIYRAVTTDGRLAGPAAKNSSSPGTSGAVEPSATIRITAPGANEMGNSGSETASATSSAT